MGQHSQGPLPARWLISRFDGREVRERSEVLQPSALSDIGREVRKHGGLLARIKRGVESLNDGETRDAHVDDTEGYSAESAPGCTREGSWLSPRLSVVVDVFSRRVVGWSMATHLRTELVLEALNMAISQRRPQQVIHHSDQGTQYTVDRLRSALPGQFPGGSPHGRLRVHRGLLQPASQTLSPGLRLAHGV